MHLAAPASTAHGVPGSGEAGTSQAAQVNGPPRPQHVLTATTQPVDRWRPLGKTRAGREARVRCVSSPQARAAARPAAALVVAAAAVIVVVVYLPLLAVAALVAALHPDRVRHCDARPGACCAAEGRSDPPGDEWPVSGTGDPGPPGTGKPPFGRRSAVTTWCPAISMTRRS